MLLLVSHMISCDTLTLSISISFKIFIPSISLFIYLHLYPSVYLYLCLSIYLYVGLSVYLSGCLFIYVSTFLIFIHPRGESEGYYRVNHYTTLMGCYYYWCGRRCTSNSGSHYNDYFVFYVKHNQR